MQEKSLRHVASALLTGAKSFALTILGLSVMAMAAWGQLDTGGSISVTVTDPSGAGIPAAALSLKDTSTNVIRKAVTQQTGTYSFQSLPYGNYELTVTKDGFDNALFQAIQVETARVTSIAAKLKVGNTQQTVTISGESPLVETQSNVLSDTIDTNQVVNLPLSGRAMFPLAFLVPGWTSTSPGSTAGTWDNMPGGAIVSADFDGTQAMSNRFRSGGFTYGTSVVSPRIEDIAEMTIQTAQLDLSGNGTASMKISMVTRRGANAFHGRLFEDFRNTDLNANSWSNDARGVPRAIINLNDFGGSIGGPILKNKLFFFGTFANSRQPGTTDTSNSVLSPSAQQGIFQYKAANGSIQSTNVLAIGASGGGAAAVNSNISSQFQAINGVLNQGYLTPTSDPNISTLTWAYASPVIDYYPAFRFDYNATDKLRFNVSYSQTKTSNPKTNGPNFPGGIDPIDYTSNSGNNKIAGVGVDYTIRPTLINQFHAGYLYQYSLFDSENLGINLATIFPQTWAYGASLYGGPYPRTAISSLYPMFSWTDSLNWQHGNHSVVFGGGWFHEQDHYWNGPGGEPATTLGIASNDPILSTFVSALTSAGLNTSQQSSAEGLYATLTGRVSSVNIDVGRPLDPKTGQYSLFGNYNLDESMQAGNMFVQDRWRIKPNLTLSYGLRWDIVGDDHDVNGGYSSPATVADFWGPTPVGAVDQPGNLSGVQNPTFQAKVHAYNTSWKNPQPAIALAWQPETSGFLAKFLPHDKTVIRTGWSLRNYQEGAQNFWAYASNSGAFFYQSGSLTAATGGAVGTFNPGTLTLGQALPPYSLFPATYSPTLGESTLTFSGSSFYAMNPNIRQPYVEQWNFGIQRQIGSASALEVRYVGNEAQHEWFSENLNEVDVTNNGFLQEFENAASNLAINQAHGNGNSFANLGLAGQVPLPIFAAEFGGVTTGSLYTQFTTNLETGAVGSVANTLSKNETYICNMFGAKFSPCVLHGLGGAGTNYPLNFWDVNPYTSGSSLNYLDASGHSNYHSLQVELRQRTWHGMEFTANYTLAHSLVLGPVNAYQANAAGSYQTIRDFRLSYRPSTYDIRNTFKLFGTYNLPFGKGKAFLHSSKLANEIVGGWNLGTILTFQSGPPTQITGGYDTFNANDGGVTFAPGVTAKTIQNAVGVYRTGNPWVDTINPKLLAPNNGVNASLTYAPNTTADIFGANPYIYGPHWFNDDMSLNKAIPIREGIRGSLQFQFLNVFNHPAFGLGTLAAQSLSFAETTATSSSTGAITTYRRIEIRANIEF
jgi:hypothetical protein